MITRGKFFGLILSAFAALLVAFPLRAEDHAKPSVPIAVIVNAASTAMTEISLAVLRRVFRGDSSQTPEGKRLVPLNGMLRSELRERFDRRVLGLEPEEVASFWINRRLRDEGLPPRIVPPELTVRVAAAFPNAIAYVPANWVLKGVRVLKIDGKLPSDEGYLLAAP